MVGGLSMGMPFPFLKTIKIYNYVRIHCYDSMITKNLFNCKMEWTIIVVMNFRKMWKTH